MLKNMWFEAFSIILLVTQFFVGDLTNVAFWQGKTTYRSVSVFKNDHGQSGVLGQGIYEEMHLWMQVWYQSLENHLCVTIIKTIEVKIDMTYGQTGIDGILCDDNAM